jgi:hypothetical protein
MGERGKARDEPRLSFTDPPPDSAIALRFGHVMKVPGLRHVR